MRQIVNVQEERQMNTQQLLTHALGRAGVEEGNTLKEIAQKLEDHLTPKVELVERSVEKLILDITSSVDAPLFTALCSGNKNLKAYAVPDGIQNGLTRISHFDRVVSEFYNDTMLIRIDLVELLRMVPLGATVRITIRKISTEGKKVLSEVSGILLPSGKKIMTPTQVTTVEHQH